ncbi:putative spermidine/putrescine transport system permease protein [Sporobacter termitidis DSM 10068]|uniref:Putative spermidine/putrescine transport system permease protein n=1 Tax=Sporobacter termitidis DSM 10068 TaxID=1123282 RepID=A0A1M5XQX0_9FIRM|nr:ABC transporter permease subunit [Sporobacter termitidis]SHI02149.1 putative spermidine/putrescine transport system permease protein [Sporobacter termitidis DSM 10068]
MVVLRSFSAPGGGVTLDNFADIFTKRLYRQAVVNSVLVSIFSALIGIVIAFLGAKAAHGAKTPLRNFFMSVLNMSSNFAGIPLAFSFIILMGNVGVLVILGRQLGIGFLTDFNLYSLNGLLLTYVYFQVPLATLLLIPAFDGLRPEWRESVSLLGGGSLTYWFRVAVPNLLPSLLGTLSILFANAIAAYATAYALLQNNFNLLPIRISEQFVGEVTQHREFGSALAVVLMVLMVLANVVSNLILKGRRGGGRS